MIKCQCTHCILVISILSCARRVVYFQTAGRSANGSGQHREVHCLQRHHCQYNKLLSTGSQRLHRYCSLRIRLKIWTAGTSAWLCPSITPKVSLMWRGFGPPPLLGPISRHPARFSHFAELTLVTCNRHIHRDTQTDHATRRSTPVATDHIIHYALHCDAEYQYATSLFIQLSTY